MESYSAEHTALETVYRLSYALDDLNYHGLAPLFLPDRKFLFDISGPLNIPAEDVTLQEYFDIAVGRLGGFEFTQHVVTNPIITANEDGTMNVQTVVTAFHGFTINGNVEGATARALWKIDLEKHNEQWFVTRWTVGHRIPFDLPDLFEKGVQLAQSGKLRSGIIRP